MRLWSLHPNHLDPRGLVALWREALLARAVLRGQTQGYRRHPQLQRFREHAKPLAALEAYLDAVWLAAQTRGYRFDRSRYGVVTPVDPMAVGEGQITLEWDHLGAKLAQRSPALWLRWQSALPQLHPLFFSAPGGIAVWERHRPPQGDWT